MVITLYTEELVQRLKTVSHHEVAEIADVEARYRAEAGTEKMELIYRCIKDAVARLESRCIRWMKEVWPEYADNTMEVPVAYKIEFSLTERRAIGKAPLLEEACETFVLEYALAKFYASVSQTPLSNSHSLAAVEAGDHLSTLLLMKQPPRPSVTHTIPDDKVVIVPQEEKQDEGKEEDDGIYLMVSQ